MSAANKGSDISRRSRRCLAAAAVPCATIVTLTSLLQGPDLGSLQGRCRVWRGGDMGDHPEPVLATYTSGSNTLQMRSNRAWNGLSRK